MWPFKRKAPIVETPVVPAPKPVPTQEEIEKKWADKIETAHSLEAFRKDNHLPIFVDPDDDNSPATVVLWANVSAAKRQEWLLAYQETFRVVMPMRDWTDSAWRPYLQPGLYSKGGFCISVTPLPLSVWRWLEARK